VVASASGIGGRAVSGMPAGVFSTDSKLGSGQRLEVSLEAEAVPHAASVELSPPLSGLVAAAVVR